ncbi:Non-essential glycogen phosphorylase [Massospora cicadina]|nr:Non-essential glycogen phosphorylase [Massospora cicadina]
MAPIQMANKQAQGSADEDSKVCDKQDSNPKLTRRLSIPRGINTLTAPKFKLPNARFAKCWSDLRHEDNRDIEAIHKSIIRHMNTTLAYTPDQVNSLAIVRDRLIYRWNNTQMHYVAKNPKRVYYLSMEFLLGRSLDNAMLSLGLKDLYSKGTEEIGFRMEDLLDEERDAALGNGGLGRLAACYVDSMASCDLPGWGYGLRYNYGMFQQRVVDGYQTEVPDYWLNFDVQGPLLWGVREEKDPRTGTVKKVWEGGQVVQAAAYDVPIPGYSTTTMGNIRLWSSRPNSSFDLSSFNEGNYNQAVDEKKSAENITSILYPNDNHMVGKELRLKQEYFLVAATLQDIIHRFKKETQPWSEFPNRVAIQLNDTHPTLAIPELQRILVDEEGLNWDEAWDIVTHTFAFTNHTVLPEALERWPVDLVKHLLPRHMEIIYAINLFFLQKVEKQFPGDRELLVHVSVIEEGTPQYLRMASLAVIGSHTVNGVAALHSHLIKTTLFKHFVRYYGNEKFTNVTNGISPRRWLHQANPNLSQLISSKLGGMDWIKDMEKLKALNGLATDKGFQEAWMDVKLHNKLRLAGYIKNNLGIDVSPDALFDIQVKRIHEYKRQFMNILSVIHRYHELKAMPAAELAQVTPRVVIFGGKAAPGYYIAKLVIKLINSVSERVNSDGDIQGKLKVVFLPDYNVSLAEVIIPASDISQHISTAGTEASGTSNMKFVLNGGLILGTVDGANIEIGEEIGQDNIFFFGILADEVEDLRHDNRMGKSSMVPSLSAVIKSIQGGEFGTPDVFAPFSTPSPLAMTTTSYKASWAAKSIRCTANMAKFSSDRSIRDYAERIWNIEACPPSGSPAAILDDIKVIYDKEM